MQEIPKKYIPSVEEEKIASLWETDDTFSFEKDKQSNPKKPLFSIDTPPPYASASHLHIGHAMSYSHAEFIARQRRMAGFLVYYPMGFDDNGLPTERYVEKKFNVNKNKISREEFRALCLEETGVVRESFKKLWRHIGLSVDWNQTYSTIDPHCQKIAQRSFIDLYKKGMMKYVDAPTMWCTQTQSAVAQADLDSVELESQFNDIAFTSEDGSELIISTTRPELLPACVGLFAHPSDTRYTHLKGKKATVPLCNYTVPILFDEAVEMDKGTGLMMVCTFGDKEDVDKWQRHGLELRMILTEYGVLNELAGSYEGLKIKDARKKIIQDLEDEGFLKSVKKIVHTVNVHDRTGVEIEFIKKKQWYIDVVSHKEKLLAQAEKITWHPEFMKVRYKNWVENLNWDWNISRQRFYGVPFPVWYSKKTGEIILPLDSDLPIDPLSSFPKELPKDHTKEDIIPETDIMDTWMTSSLTPQINYNWKDEDENVSMKPMSLRPQAHDIIRTWAFYTIAKSLYHEDAIPWKDIAISGHGQDPHGKKMSKSKGNVVWVDDVLKKYSADALRYWAAGSGLGVDCPYQEKDVLTGNKVVTKLWNSFKFTSMFFDDTFDPSNEVELTAVDKWMLSKLSDLITKVSSQWDEYKFDKATFVTDSFFWDVFCDNYLEIVKDRLYKEDIYGVSAKKSGQYTLYHSLKTMCQLFHPITPFVTESIWQYFFKRFEKESSIAVSSWPKPFSVPIDEKTKSAAQLAIDMSSLLRKYKSDNQKPLNAQIALKISCSEILKEQFLKVESDVVGTAKVGAISFVSKSDIRGDISLFEADESLDATSLDKAFFSFDVEFIQE